LALTAPELSVLLAYTKIVLAAQLLASELPDDPFMRGALYRYFPSKMRKTYRTEMEAHPLRREIIVTQIVNDMVNSAGITFFHRLSQETSASVEELARAHLVCQSIYGAPQLVQRINELDNQIPADVQTGMRLSVRALIERASRWMVNNRRPPLDSEATADHFRADIQRVMSELSTLLVGVQADEFKARQEQLMGRGVAEDLATHVAILPFAYSGLEVVEIAKRDGLDAVEVARVHATLAERLGLSQLAAKIAALPREDRWQTMARASLRDDFHAVHAALTAQVLASTQADVPAETRVAEWESGDSVVVTRATATIDEILAGDEADLARLSVGLRVIRTMLTA